MRKIIFLVIAVAVVLAGCTLTNNKNEQAAIGLEAAKAKAADFINKNLLQPGSTATVASAVEENGLYKLTVNLSSGQEITSYLTTDGKKFFPSVYDIAETESQKQAEPGAPAAAATQSLADIPKKDKAQAELFVMSFCPYGVQAETAIAPAVELLKDKADIQVRFIASVAGNDLSAVKSLHGTIEGIEDARQLCIAKNYDTTVLWKYINKLNVDCYPIYRNGEEAYKTCWQKTAKDAGINVSKIETCLTNEGVTLIKKEDEAAKAYGVTGSPTFLVNGTKYSGERTAEAFKQAICAGFTTPPAECSETLSATGATASGDCN